MYRHPHAWAPDILDNDAGIPVMEPEPGADVAQGAGEGLFCPQAGSVVGNLYRDRVFLSRRAYCEAARALLFLETMLYRILRYGLKNQGRDKDAAEAPGFFHG